jgi:hypothetical protein
MVLLTLELPCIHIFPIVFCCMAGVVNTT